MTLIAQQKRRDTIDPNGNNGTNGNNGVNGNNGQNGSGQMNEGTINNDSNTPNGSSGPNGENGITAPGAPSVNQEDIIEDKKDRKDNDQIDNH